MSEMTIKGIAPWFGSKRTLAPTIIEELGEHRAYFEPFCGSMSVLMAKNPVGHETVNDLHGNLINLARVIQDCGLGSLLYRRLRRVVIHEALLEEAWSELAAIADEPSPSLDRAFWYFVASWCGRNGFAGTTNVVGTRGIAVRWTPGGGQRFASAVDSIPAWRRRLRNVTILQRDALEVVSKIDDAQGVAVYVDPPYLKKDGEYEHDFTDDCHERLAVLLRRFKRARVVVSYYEHPALAALYPDWTMRDCIMNKGVCNAVQRGRGGKKAPEVLLTNGPSFRSQLTL